MSNIEETRKAVIAFLKQILNVNEVTVVNLRKGEDRWEAEAEVFEESTFIKSLGLSTKAKDRNIYSVILNDGMEVLAYERREQFALHKQ